MPKKLNKSLRVYLSKLKKIRSLSLPNPGPATNSLLSACKYPKTPSFAAVDRQTAADHVDNAATLSDVDRFLYENFHSLYLDDDDEGDVGKPRRNTIRPLDRFFSVSPGTSSSLADEARTSSSSLTTTSSMSSAVTDGVAVVTFSKDPYEDFRRSMRDMVESQHTGRRQSLDWDFMEELLFCYLELNDRSVHKHVLRAFTDLTVSFRRKAPAGPTARRRRRMMMRECRESDCCGSESEEEEEEAAELLAEEKVKDCYYERRKHVQT